jgi:filamentous hemagglutinin
LCKDLVGREEVEHFAWAINAEVAGFIGRNPAAIVRPAVEVPTLALRGTPTTTAQVTVGGRTFTDVNQTARPLVSADASQATLIADRAIARGGATAANGNMATAHAEIGAIQQAYNAGATVGQDMVMNVTRAPCTYCAGDIPEMASRAGLRSLIIYYRNPQTLAVTVYRWTPGIRTLRPELLPRGN